jgi:predicted outer membrane repeat protein
MGCAESSSILVHNVFAHNAAYSGGGISTDDASVLTITNNTFFNNSATHEGGGIACGNGFSIITNTILWNNDAPAGSQIHGMNPIVTYCDVEGGWPGAGNIDADPLFVDPQTEDFHVSIDSPCVNKGDVLAPCLPDKDFEDDPRIAYGIVDIGVDEYYLGGLILHVPEHYPSIQEAIDSTLDGDIVLVAPGTYFENIIFQGNIILKSKGGPEVTILDGNHSGSVITIQSAGPTATLDGFTITHGSASEGGGIRYYIPYGGLPITITNNIITENIAEITGGGINCYFGCPIILGNTITDNEAAGGGGIYCYYGTPTIAGNMISNNQVVNDGGGIQCHSSEVIIMNNTITENTADERGGGVLCSGCYNHAISGNTISKNRAGLYGGGIFCGYDQSFYNSTISNNMITGNTAYKFGGGIFCIGNDSYLVNNTLADNFAGTYGGGICCYKNSSTIVTNTILSNNSAQTGPEVYVGKASDLTLSYSDVNGGQVYVQVDPEGTLTWGSGMIDADPLLQDPLNDDYHLSCVSPCIDAGNSYASLLPALDIEGDPRIFPGNGKGVYLVGSPSQAAIVDMGADEYCLLKREQVTSK